MPYHGRYYLTVCYIFNLFHKTLQASKIHNVIYLIIMWYLFRKIEQHVQDIILSPVTGADDIFWSQGGLFVQYPGSAEVLQKQSHESWKFPSVPVTSDSFFFLHIIFVSPEKATYRDYFRWQCRRRRPDFLVWSITLSL